MINLSAIILADDKEIITDCLKSVNWVKDIIIIDLGLTKKTFKLIEKYNYRVIKGSQEYNFSQWRNQGAKTAKGDWLLYLDTDERVTASLREEILSTITHQPSAINAYFIPRKNYFWGKEFKSSWPDFQLRLIKKSALLNWQGKIHEIPLIKGNTGYLKNAFTHLSHRNIESCLSNTLKWSWLEAENRMKAHHPKMTSLRFLRIMATGFYDQFINKKIWREGTEGVIEGIYQIFSLFITYVRLWELQNK